MASLYKSKIHFLHIGKTGGSALKYVLGNFLNTQEYILELHHHNVSLKHIPEGEKVIFFLRDPISRFISGFYSRKRKGQPRYYSEWNQIETEVFNTFSTPNELALALHNGNPLALKAMNNIQHFRRYNQWYIDLDYFYSRRNDILFIGFQESLNEDFERLKSILGIENSIVLPDDNILVHKNPEGLDKRLTMQAYKTLEEWFMEDFEFVSLCRQMY